MMTWPLNTPPTITRTLEVLLPTGIPAALVAEDSRRAWAREITPTGAIFSPGRQRGHGTLSTWCSIAPDQLIRLVDGSLQTLTTATHTASSMGNFSNSSLYFMSRAASSLNAAGTLDEVRLSTIERSASWTATEYNNQSSPGTFITMGNETCATPTPTPTATPTVTPTPTPTSTSTPTPTPTPRPGLVAAYGFNEGSGTVVTDVSGNGNNGTISGATWTTSGKYGNALIFNGTNALVTINNAASLQLTSGMTLEAWVYPTTVSNKSRDVIYKGNDNYYLEGSTNNSRRPALGGTFGSPIYGTAALTANTWTHLAGTYDGATMSLYINGV